MRDLSYTLVLNNTFIINYVVISLADRGHPLNSLTGDGEFVNNRSRALSWRDCILTAWDRQCSCVISKS